MKANIEAGAHGGVYICACERESKTKAKTSITKQS